MVVVGSMPVAQVKTAVSVLEEETMRLDNTVVVVVVYIAGGG